MINWNQIKSNWKKGGSLYEKLSGQKNPKWADKVYNDAQFPSIAERLFPKSNGGQRKKSRWSLPSIKK